MRFARTFGFRIAFGFSFLIIAIIINALVSQRIVVKIRDTQQEVTDILYPSIRDLSEFRSIVLQTKNDLQAWEFSGRDSDSPILDDVRSLLQAKMPEIHQQISDLLPGWAQGDREAYDDLYTFINDSLFTYISKFTSSLYQMSAADSLYTPASLPVLLNAYRFIDIQLLDLIQKFEQDAGEAEQAMQSTYSKNGSIILVNGIIIALAAILIAILLFYSIYNPVKNYRNTISSMGRGNFRSDFKPLSDDDTLGNSLIQLRENLRTAAIEEEKRKREDERRKWSNQGIARFSEILGVIEIATLEVFEDFQIEFTERIGTSIASSISAAFAEELEKTKHE
ncbi:MAG: hypothetical protein AMS23_06735 [Bacteroides sp. SM1_62]|nr:MAG: hypothetical protein AMS23_06735 [Bacteroides sp. SM1_62]